jgi:hypothetical protein
VVVLGTVDFAGQFAPYSRRRVMHLSKFMRNVLIAAAIIFVVEMFLTKVI